MCDVLAGGWLFFCMLSCGCRFVARFSYVVWEVEGFWGEIFFELRVFNLRVKWFWFGV